MEATCNSMQSTLNKTTAYFSYWHTSYNDGKQKFNKYFSNGCITVKSVLSFHCRSWTMLSFWDIICASEQLNRVACAYYGSGDVVNVYNNSINVDVRDL